LLALVLWCLMLVACFGALVLDALML